MKEAYTEPVNINAAKLQQLSLSELTRKGLQADVLRLDQIHPVISGNKWFKLRYHLEAARLNRQKMIVTFGGAYSNHVVATACICRQLGLSLCSHHPRRRASFPFRARCSVPCRTVWNCCLQAEVIMR